MGSVKLKYHRIRIIEEKDISQVLAYIAKEWNSEHVFVKKPEFFLYEHFNGENINGILAESLETGKIDGILLMYPLGNGMTDLDFFGGIWSVSKDCKVPMLGIKLVENVLKVTGAKSHSGVGISPDTTAKIFQHIEGQKVGKLKHYYRLGNKSEYKIANIKVKKISEIKNGSAKFKPFYNIEELDAFFELTKYKEEPYYKDSEYIQKRYFDHPIYNYNIFGIDINGKIESVFIFRKIEHNSAKIVRIVDFLGDDQALKECGKAFQEMLDEDDLEYIDFYEYGLEDAALIAAGFIEREDSDNNVIPNYFEPYMQKNIDLWFHTPYDKCRIFKGDGDQDRPNCIE